MDAQEAQIYTAIIVATIVIGSVVAYFIFSIIRHNKKVLLIQRENARAQITMLENDRSRIAADLHDDLAPMLVAVKMRINSFELANETDKQQLERTNEVINDIAKRMRAISFDLMPSTLQEKGLLMAVKEFVSYTGSHHSLKIRLLLNEEPVELSEQKTIHTYRIVQEIIQNTIKHAKASELLIALKKEKDYLVLTCRDDGIGFDYAKQLKDGKGLGLKSLLNRIQLLKAEMVMDSRPGKGTALTVRIPTADEQLFEN